MRRRERRSIPQKIKNPEERETEIPKNLRKFRVKSAARIRKL